MKVTTKIPEGTDQNFETLKKAFRDNRIVLLRAHDKKTNRDVTLLCGINFIEEEYVFVPLAVMMEDNPFERFIPPE